MREVLLEGRKFEGGDEIFSQILLNKISEVLEKKGYAPAKVFIMGIGHEFFAWLNLKEEKKRKKFLLKLMDEVEKEFQNEKIPLSREILFMPAYIFKNLNAIIENYK